MRFIASCPQCQVQYWSDEEGNDQNFYCQCGELVRLKSSHGKDARIVRCSACGASREEKAAYCNSCKSDFTIHEKDLNTICPHCTARISDIAKFCHHCGLKISPQFSMGKQSKMACPACEGEKPLYLRRESDALIFLECHVCAGMWLKMEGFEQLIEKTKTEHFPSLILRTKASKTPIEDLSEEAKLARDRFYRPCPPCKSLMLRRNVGMSGVVVDYCKDHGVWFDGNELAQLMDWIRQGGIRSKGAGELLPKGKGSASKLKKSKQASSLTEIAEDSDLWDILTDFVYDVFD